ncbi:hypothetical protein HHL11_08935 [Ramlibacter sp. G-1-2-2]|uniref:Rap1a immunity protein domain-containing protein n=1 Tax=Ramlibacter agri TaxID=2728837 RepID=A0A848H2S5_9BURK|nr:hypothetical protein [Ramlibacter agri]NML43871.1 hypothetical protein [Ramlibacter agri]
MIRRGKYLALAAGMLVAAGAAHATMSVAQFKEGRFAAHGSQSATIFEMYLTGLADGVQSINTMADRAGGKRLYCVPGGFVLDADTTKKLIMMELRGANALDNARFDSTAASVVLLKALMDSYPCR